MPWENGLKARNSENFLFLKMWGEIHFAEKI